MRKVDIDLWDVARGDRPCSCHVPVFLLLLLGLLLDADELGVVTAWFVLQLGRSPFLDKAALLEDEDPVGVLDGAEPVGDHDRGDLVAFPGQACLHLVDRGLHFSLVALVEG